MDIYKNLSDSRLILFITNKKCSEPTPLVLDNFRRFSSNSSKFSVITCIYNAVSKSFFYVNHSLEGSIEFRWMTQNNCRVLRIGTFKLLTCKLCPQMNKHKSFVIWASARENLSSGVYEQQRRKPACAYAQSDQRLCYSLNEKYHI